MTNDTGCTILLVDDAPDILMVIGRILAAMCSQCEVVTATNGVEALAQFEARPAGLVIADYNMSEMNGLQLTRAIKERSPSTRVLIITAYATSDVEKRARESGADYYLAKPFAIDELVRVVEEVVLEARQAP